MMLRVGLATIAAARAVLVFGEAGRMQDDRWAERLVSRLRLRVRVRRSRFEAPVPPSLTVERP